MKKYVFILAALFSMPSFAAVDIAADANTADCDSDVLKTTTGPASLEANWDANQINLNWYAGADSNTPLTVQTGAQTCTYDGNITLPTTNPTKPGYTFDHWQVRQQSCFAGLDPNINGFDAGCLGSGGYDINVDKYNLTSVGQWATEFNYGVVRGISSCNNTYPSERAEAYAALENGTITQEQYWAKQFAMPNGTFSSNSTGQYCWCQIESFTPTGGNVCSEVSPVWVVTSDQDDAESCAAECPQSCASGFISNHWFRAALFGVSQ